MANYKTVLKKEKSKFKEGSRYFTSGDARAYQFIHQTVKQNSANLRELRQENIFIFGKQ